MQRPNPETVTLNDILITEELSRRASRTPNLQAENQAMRVLIQQMAQNSENLMQTLVDTALALCEAGTTGLSLLETTADREEIFCWNALAGTLAHHVGNSTSRDFSPCGVCLEQRSPVLFSHPDRYFTYFQDANTPIVEGLVLPLIVDHHIFGTIWVMSHDEQRHFDLEDVRIMASLADFTATALLLQQRQTQELLAANAALEAEVIERKQAEEQTRALISNLPGGAAFVVDRDLRYLLAEGEALAIAGFKPEDFVGRTIFEALPPELAANYEPMYRKALTGEPFEVEHHAYNHWYISRGTPLQAETGEIYAVLVVSYDITERKRIEDECKQAEQALHECEARLALELTDARQLQFISSQLVQEENIDALYEQILEAAIALMRSDMGSMQRLHLDRNELQLLAWKGFDPASAAFWEWVQVDSNSICGVALRTGERAIVPDVETCELMAGSGDLDAYHRSGVRAVQTTPLISRSGQVVGMISTHWQEPHQPSERELRLLDVLARQAADLIEQWQAEAALHQSEAKYRSLFDSIDEGFCIFEMIYNEAGEAVDFCYIETNPAFERQSGRRPQPGQTMRELFPEAEDMWLKDYAEVASTGQAKRFIDFHEDLDRWFDVFVFPSSNGKSQLAALFSDVTDEKRAEEALRANEERQAFLLQLSDALRPLVDPIEIQEAVTRTAMHHFGADRCYYCELEGENAIIRRDAARDGLPSVTGIYPLSSFAILQAVIEAGRPFVVQDVYTTNTVDDDLRQLCIQLQVISYIDVPVIKDGKPVGVLCLVQSTPRDWTELEVELAVETAERTWSAVERARAEDALGKSEAKYRSLFTTMDQGFCIVEKVETAPGQPSDFRYITVNPAFERHTGLSDVVGRTMREFLLNAEHHVVDIYNAVVHTRQSQHFEEYVSELDLWFEIEVFSAQLPGQIAILFSNVSDRKRAELALRESEERLQKAISIETIGVLFFTLDGHITDANDTFLQMSGYSWNELRNLTNWHDLTPPEFWDVTRGAAEELATWGNTAPYEKQHIRKDGARWWGLFSPTRLKGSGHDAECVEFVIDISEAKRVEDERKQAEAQLRRAVEMDAFRVKLSDALRPLADPVQIQAEACRLLGEQLGTDRAYYVEIHEAEGYACVNQHYSRGDSPSIVGNYPLSEYGWSLPIMRRGETIVITDMQSTTIIPDAERAAMAMIGMIGFVALPLIKGEGLVGALAVNEPAPREWTEAEVELVRETGERIWADIQRAHVETALHESELQRIREQSAREEERQRAESLAELDRAKTAFFSNVSHEFRTPLTLSLAPLQDALSDRTLPAIHRERLELVHRNSLRLLKLVNTLLDFSRIEAGRMEAVYEPTDLATYTTELASVFRSAIERAGLQLMIDCPPLPEPVFVDREMWEKIVLNLLSNAFKFTFEGEITVSLKAESRIELPAPTSNVHDSTSGPQSPNSELDIPTSKLQISSSELDTLTSEPDTLTSELDPLTCKLETTPAEKQATTFNLEPSSSELEATPLEKQATPSNLQVILKIHDTGTGIAPEHLPHLFERFYQVRGSQARTYEGSGIGLALVNELVQLQGGTIEVSSTLGEGTCFTISLLLGTEHLPSDRLRRGEAQRIASPKENCLQDEGERPPIRTLSSTAMSATTYVEEAERWLSTDNNRAQTIGNVEEQAAQNSNSSLPNHTSGHVLVVDDNADMREYLTHILNDYVQVEAVADGITALAVAQERVPDLILSDVMMPGLDGFELLQALRSNPHTREVPIILLSARAGEEAIVEGLEAGADDYLIKPFSAQELISRVTAHLQMAQLRGEALQQERIMNRQKDEFISVVSHELNTPLVSILGWTRMLRSSPPNPVMLSKALDTIERNAALQAKLIQDLLDLSRITTGKFRLNPQPIELQPVIETAIATVTQTAADKGIHLTWQENVIEPVVVMGDSDRLQQVICNLLTNAIKFTPESGSVTLELSVMNNNGSADAAYAEIQVIDTGDGIAVDFLPYVFDRFRQAEGAKAVKGLGLGLAIARHIIELHHGTIYAESAGEGQGTTLLIQLPMFKSTLSQNS